KGKEDNEVWKRRQRCRGTGSVLILRSAAVCAAPAAALRHSGAIQFYRALRLVFQTQPRSAKSRHRGGTSAGRLNTTPPFVSLVSFCKKTSRASVDSVSHRFAIRNPIVSPRFAFHH